MIYPIQKYNQIKNVRRKFQENLLRSCLYRSISSSFFYGVNLPFIKQAVERMADPQHHRIHIFLAFRSRIHDGLRDSSDQSIDEVRKSQRIVHDAEWEADGFIGGSFVPIRTECIDP